MQQKICQSDLRRNADATTTWAKKTELAIESELSIATMGSGPIKSFAQAIRRSIYSVGEASKRELGATLRLVSGSP